MKLPIRLENAITKLYTAYHSGELDAMNCEHCAVGSICNNDSAWDNLPIFQSTLKWGNYIQPCDYELELAEIVIKESGYSKEELQKVEIIFLTATDFKKGDKETQFKGLCAVVEYLCELDNVPNVMDYTKLFETENNQPKYVISL